MLGNFLILMENSKFRKTCKANLNLKKVQSELPHPQNMERNSQ